MSNIIINNMIYICMYIAFEYLCKNYWSSLQLINIFSLKMNKISNFNFLMDCIHTFMTTSSKIDLVNANSTILNTFSVLNKFSTFRKL